MGDRTVPHVPRAMRATGQCNIQPVIDDHWNPNRGDQPPQNAQQVTRTRLLEPKLDARHPTPLGGLTHGHRVARAQQPVVSDQHEPQDRG